MLEEGAIDNRSAVSQPNNQKETYDIRNNSNVPGILSGSLELGGCALLTEIVANINRTNSEIDNKTADLIDLLGQFRGTTSEAQEELEKFLAEFEK